MTAKEALGISKILDAWDYKRPECSDSGISLAAAALGVEPFDDPLLTDAWREMEGMLPVNLQASVLYYLLR